MDGFGVVAKLWKIEEIEAVYQNLEIMTNEQGIEEIGFRDIKMAEKFVEVASQLSSLYNSNQTKFSMQFLADVMRRLYDKKLIAIEDLYRFSEREIIEKIENCGEKQIVECFKIWRNATKIRESDEKVEGKYCVNLEKVKVRYIDPLVKGSEQAVRVSQISRKARKDIEMALAFQTGKYAYLDFDLA